MVSKQFDAWTRDLIGRRSALAVLFGGAGNLLGLAPHAAAKKRKKKRCRKSERRCAKSKDCCQNLECTNGICCRPERIVVECDARCICPDDHEFCCAYVPEPPVSCPGPVSSPLHCCAAGDVCGDVCCNPEFFACDRTTDTCSICKLPDLNDCPSGGGTYIRLRRVK